MSVITLLLLALGAGDPATAIEKRVVSEMSGVPSWTARTDMLTAVGDVNGDGLDDVAVLHRSSGELQIWLARPDHSFVRGEKLTVTHSEPTSLLIARTRSGGKNDLVLGHAVHHGRGAGIEIHPGLGSGRFGPPRMLLEGIGTASVAVGDLDGDGHPDLVAGADDPDGDDDSLQIVWGGAKGFEPPVVLKSQAGPHEVAVADLGAHRLRVVALAKDSGTVAVFAVKRGQRQLEQLADVALPDTSRGPRNYHELRIADVNGDGLADLLVAGAIHQPVSIATGTSDGGFAPFAVVGSGAASTHLLVADIDGDGHPDLVVANPMGGVRALLSDGKGQFPQEQSVNAEKWAAPVVGRFSEGRGDALAAVGVDSVRILETRAGDKSGDAPAPRSLVVGTGAHTMVVADFDGDGLSDVAAVRPLLPRMSPQGPEVELSILHQTPQGAFSAPTRISLGTPGFAIEPALTVGDFNGHGRIDLVMGTNMPERANLFLNQGATFSASNPVEAGHDVWKLIAADLNGDGVPDLAVLNRIDQTVSVLLSVGGGGFAPRETYSTGQHPSALAAGDLDGDGRPDLVVLTEDQVTILHNQGKGVFATGPSYATPGGHGDLAVADLDGDGKLGVVAVARGDGPAGVTQLQVYLSMAHGELKPLRPTPIPAVRLVRRLVPGNFLGHSRPDFLVLGLGAKQSVFLRNLGHGKLEAEEWDGEAVDARAIRIAGRPNDDLAVMHFEGTFEVVEGGTLHRAGSETK